MAAKIIIPVLCGVAFLGWTERDMLKTQWQKYTQKTESSHAAQSALYTWKDKNGTVHFSATPDHKNATLTTVDTSKISRLEPLPQSNTAQTKQDKLLLLEVRDELKDNVHKMQQEKERRVMQQ